jgi:tripartite-type tricarboxylate transporter receptor subunit TctC
MPSMQVENWYGMVAPAGTPQDVIATLNKAAVDAIKDPTVAAKLSSQGAILIGDTPEEFRAFIASETQKWATVIRDAGVPTEK